MTDEQIASIQYAADWLSRSEDIGNRKHGERLRALLSASIADTAGAKPVAEVVNKYGDPDAFAERDLIVNEEILKALPFGTQLFAAPPAPSSDTAGVSGFREAGVWDPDGKKFTTYRNESLNGKAMYVKEQK